MLPHYTPAFIDAFWTRVDRSGGPDACWPWTGARTPDGYGRVAVGRLGLRTHRVAYELANGPIPDGLVLLHTVCDNPPCCNERHLKADTTRANQAEKAAKGRSASGFRNGVHTHPETRARGERHGLAKLTVAQVESIRARYQRGVTPQVAFAREYGVSQVVVSRIVRGVAWIEP